MLRVAASIGLLMLAVAITILGMVLIFMVIPSAWEALFGPGFAPFAAIVAMGGMIWVAARVMRFGDRLLSDQDHRRARRLVAAEAEVSADWREYSATIVRNKRWAFYRRTHQFDRLAELVAESKRARRP